MFRKSVYRQFFYLKIDLSRIHDVCTQTHGGRTRSRTQSNGEYEGMMLIARDTTLRCTRSGSPSCPSGWDFIRKLLRTGRTRLLQSQKLYLVTTFEKTQCSRRYDACKERFLLIIYHWNAENIATLCEGKTKHIIVRIILIFIYAASDFSIIMVITSSMAR
jgi:hypothetical protein